MLLTSGTLSPLNSFADELGLPFAQRLENPHVINPQAQLLIGTFPKGPSGHELSSTYQLREAEANRLDLGNALVNFARVVPQGVLVFFPSYSALSSAHAAWMRPAAEGGPSVLERIRKMKTLVVEPRDASELPGAIDDFQGAVKRSVLHGTGGAMLFAVCRGKLSEGVDFADAACRGVVITGLPLPPIVDAKVELKKQFLDERQAAARRTGGQAAGGQVLSGEAWYHQQAMRAVNQAVGRVIRHVNDYGAVLLCESRFSKRAWADGLSLWLRPHLKQFTSFGQGYPTIQRFFRLRAAEVAAATDGAQSCAHDGAADDAGADGGVGGRPRPTASRPLALPPAPGPPPSLMSALSAGASAAPPVAGPGQAPPALLMACEPSSLLSSATRASLQQALRVGTATDEPAVAGTKLMSAAQSAEAAGGAVGGPEGGLAKRRTWVAREDLRSLPTGRSFTIGRDGTQNEVGTSYALADPPSDACASGAGSSAPAGGANPKAVAMLDLARRVLPVEAYERFMGIVRELLAMRTTMDAEAEVQVPPQLLARMLDVFGSPGRQELCTAFIRFVPKQFRQVRPVLAPLTGGAITGGAVSETSGKTDGPGLLSFSGHAKSGMPKPNAAPERPMGSSVAREHPRSSLAVGSRAGVPVHNGKPIKELPRAMMANEQRVTGGTHSAASNSVPQLDRAAPASSSLLSRVSPVLGQAGSCTTTSAMASKTIARTATGAREERGGEGHGSGGGKRPATEGASAADHGSAVMKAVKQGLNDDVAYARFKSSMKEALVKLKKAAARSRNALSSEALRADSDPAAGEWQRETNDALRSIHELFATSGLTPIAANLEPLLPRECKHQWRQLLSDHGL